MVRTFVLAAIEVGNELRGIAPLDLLQILLRRLGQAITEQRVVTRLMLQAAMHPDFAGMVEEALRPGSEALEELLGGLMAEGTLRTVPTYAVISVFVDALILCVVVESVKSNIYGMDFSDQTVMTSYVDDMIDLMMKGLIPA